MAILCWNSSMQLGTLSPSSTHTAYPVIAQAKKLRHALWIDTSTGRKDVDRFLAARQAQHTCSLSRYRQTNLRIYAWDWCRAGRNATLKEPDTGDRRMRGSYGT